MATSSTTSKTAVPESLLGAHADLTEEITRGSVSAVRELIPA
jgi:hypothetical protein